MKLELNVNKDEPSNNDFIYICEEYKQIPNKIFLHDVFSGKYFESVIEDFKVNIINSVGEYIPNGDSYILNKKILIELNEQIYCSYLIVNASSEDSFVEDVLFYYKEEEKEEKITEIIELIIQHTLVTDDTPSNLNTISLSGGKLDVVPMIEMESDIKTKHFYNDDTFEDIKKMVNNINNNDNGISILYGRNGCGKTDLIYYLSKKTNRRCIFIPNNAVDITINSPEFKDYINKFEKPLLIIDDCEYQTNTHVSHMNLFSSNILQLCDGVICDDVQIILIFNVPKSQLDTNLIQSGSLMNLINFDKLKPKKATNLSSKLGYNKKFTEPTKLYNVYNNKVKLKTEKIGL